MVRREPLTTDDFRYCWEDVWLNKDLTPGGRRAALLVDGKPPLFEIVDAPNGSLFLGSAEPGFPAQPRRPLSP